MNRPDDPLVFDWKRPDYDAVLVARAERLERLRADPALLADMREYYRESPVDLIHDFGCCFDPRVRRAGRIDSLSAIEWKSRGDHLEPRPRALSQEQMARPRKSSRHA